MKHYIEYKCNAITWDINDYAHTNWFQNLVKENQIWIVFTLFSLIWHQTDIRLMPNNQTDTITIHIWFNLPKTQIQFHCV